jgi:hypothetical protein
MVIQILVTVGVLLFVFPNLYTSLKKKSLTPFAFVVWVVCWIAGLLLIWFPHFIDLIGSKLGVGRSIDAFVYIAIVYLIYASLIQKLKVNEIEKEITMLNRKLALKDVNSKDKKDV